MLWIFSPRPAMVVDIWPSILGTLALAIARRKADSRGIYTWHMQSDEIAVPEQIIYSMCALDLGGKTPGSIHRNLRVIAQHLHAEFERGICHHAADSAKAYDTEGASRQFNTGEMLFAIFDHLGQCGIVTLQSVNKAHRRYNVARRHQHAGQHQFLN